MSKTTDLTLLGARYRKMPNPGFADGISVGDACANLGQHLGINTRELRSACGDLPVDQCYFCSTILDLPFAGEAFDQVRFLAAAAAVDPVVPDTIVNAYECVCWGYILRHVAHNIERPTRVLMHIVDVDVLNLVHWRANSAWGHSGFGIMSLLFEVCPAAKAEVVVGSARTEQHVTEFVLELRKFVAARPGLPIALPYLPKDISGIFSRTMAAFRCLPDLHPELGHCFGSDPWIGIVRHALEAKRADDNFIASSIALNGYWAMALVHVPMDAPLTWEDCS
jgi:hypothetical protein